MFLFDAANECLDRNKTKTPASCRGFCLLEKSGYCDVVNEN